MRYAVRLQRHKSAKRRCLEIALIVAVIGVGFGLDFVTGFRPLTDLMTLVLVGLCIALGATAAMP